MLSQIKLDVHVLSDVFRNKHEIQFLWNTLICASQYNVSASFNNRMKNDDYKIQSTSFTVILQG